MNQNKRKNSKPLKRSPLKAQSQKGAASNRKYAEVCKEIDEEMIDEIGYIRCVSCHKTRGYLDHSHLLPKSNFPLRKTEKANIQLRCRDCHNSLDKNDFEKIKNFKDLVQIMEYLYKEERLEYNKYVIGLREAGCLTYY